MSAGSYPRTMEMIPITTERKAQDFQEAVEGVRLGYEDFKAGRVRPIEEAFKQLREKQDLPR
jgi:hypothetical protein